MLPNQTKQLQHTFSFLSVLTFFIFMGGFTTLAQERPKQESSAAKLTQKATSDDLLDTPSDPATYPGGLRAFNRDFIRHFKLSRPLIVDARVILTFIVEEDGSLSDMRVIQNPRLDISKAALAALAKTKNWIPAKHNGELVRTQFTLPVTIAADKPNQTDQTM